jgi:kinesin family protein 6/9
MGKNEYIIFPEILRDKKNSSRELSLRINATKVELDKVKKLLEEKQEERMRMGGSVLPETEKEVIDEDEFQYLQKFQELKAQYRTDFYELRSVMSDIQCCEKHVSQCRKKLVTEFDIWYADSYLGEESENNVETESVERKPRKSIAIEDEQEKFDRLQLEYLMDEPESVAYYNAQMQTQRRAYYTDIGRQRQKPVLTKRRTNEPPGMLTTY